MRVPGPPALIAVAILVVAACTVERRADARPDGGAADGESPAARSAAAEDSARAVASAFHEALLLGDGARVVSLTAPGAVLVDQEEGVRWQRSTDADLPDPLGRGRQGLSWVVTSSEFTDLGEAGLLVTRYLAEVEGEEVPWSAVESMVLVRSPEGMKILYMHRSRGREDGGGGGSDP